MQRSTTRNEASFQPMLLGWQENQSLTEVADLITTQVQLFLGIDRVVIYQFDRVYNGQVIAEAGDETRLPSLKGLHFPAGDIPLQARAFLLKARQRIIVDVAARHKSIAVSDDEASASLAEPADIRYTPVDPCHVQYLLGMGVLASLTFSIVHQGKLWGLLVGHHSESRQFSEAEIQTVQLWTDQLLVALAQDLLRQQVQQHQAREALRTKLTILMGQETLTGDPWQKVLQVLAEDLEAAGCRLYLLPGGLDDQERVSTYGLQPVAAVEPEAVWSQFCRALEPVKVVSTAVDLEPVPHPILVGDAQTWTGQPQGEILTRLLTPAGISSVLVVPIYWQEAVIGYLSLYRQDEVQEVTWAGEQDTDHRNHYPRASFAAWQEQRQQPRYWEHRDLELARLAGRHLSMELMQHWVKTHMNGRSAFDETTHLPNWLVFNKRLQVAILQCLRQGKALAIAILNIDQFKRINNAYGHTFGNYVLQSVAHRLTACLHHNLALAAEPEAAMLARWHSDKFALLLPADGGQEVIGHYAQAILDSLKSPFLLQGEAIYLTGSLGVALAPYDGNTADLLIRHAEAAMHQARQQGCGRYQMYDALADASDSLSHQRLANDLYRALTQQELTLYYQPQVDIQSDRVIGVEALVRWQHPQLGLVPPDRFIRIAEESGLICQLDEWVLRTACLQYQQWRQAGLPPLQLAVNLSATQFQAPGLVALVQEVLQDTEMTAAELEIEITEETVTRDLQRAVATLRQLKEMGLQIALDDFGTGYSSLNVLKYFPVDTLKIDRSFVRNAPHDRQDAAIAQTIMALGHGLNLHVLAEGVETVEQVNWLKDLGCDRLQGYYISRPQPASAMVQWLQDHLRAQPQPRLLLLPAATAQQYLHHPEVPESTLYPSCPVALLEPFATASFSSLPPMSQPIAVTSMAAIVHPSELHTQLHQEQLIRSVTEKIRQSLHIEDILSTIVEEVRYLLDTDRVVLYRFSENWEGCIVQESVCPTFQSILGRQIIDRCFAEKYVKYYRQGRVRAIDDVDTADIADCHRDLLRSLDIRANLVVPVAYQDRLWGLLIAHQCRGPRLWQQEELDLLGQLAVQSAIAIHQGELYEQLEVANRQLQKLSTQDGLTQVANRSCFDQQLQEAWQRLQRSPAPLALILCDIDYFKQYNDTYGHLAGDRCLQQVAAVLQAAVQRPCDLVARYGGEEFVILLPDTHLAGAQAIAERIQQSLGQLAIPHGESPLQRVTLSLGLACQIPRSAARPEDLVQQADDGLYRAKAAGRNAIRTSASPVGE